MAAALFGLQTASRARGGGGRLDRRSSRDSPGPLPPPPPLLLRARGNKATTFPFRPPRHD
ncbi:hypothetical protein E2320_007935 [Naja naja]|nr:hypothetical protein E2320_007935 [Naja naja]